MNHREIVLITQTNQDTLTWLMAKKYIPDLMNCRSCINNRMNLERNGTKYRWRCGKCKGSVSPFQNTILFNSNLELTQIVDLIYFWSLDVTQNIARNEVGTLSRQTITKWYKTLSLQSFYIMRQLLPQKIGGPGKIVEVDEAKFSKRKFNVGRVTRSPWVIGGVDIENGNVFFREVLFRNRETINSVLLECVELGSIVVTDCWAGYIDLESLGYQHLTVNHSQNFVDPDTMANTQAIENRWSVYKHKLRARYINYRSDLCEIFTEFMFKLKFKNNAFITIMSNLNKFS